VQLLPPQVNQVPAEARQMLAVKKQSQLQPPLMLLLLWQVRRLPNESCLELAASVAPT